MKKYSSEKVTFRRMEETDLRQVLCWRNHISIRSVMLNSDMISFDEHVAWFNRCSLEKDRVLLIYEVDGQPYGFANISPFLNTNCCEWGFYLDPNAPKHVRGRFGIVLLNFIFYSLNFDTIYGKVFKDNLKSIRFHERLGFDSAPMEGDSGLSEFSPNTMIMFSLSREKWFKLRSES